MSRDEVDGEAVDGEAVDAPERVVAVPCEGADALALFALATGDPLGSIPVGSHPVHAATLADRTFVATMGERSVTAVDPDRKSVV